MSGEMSSSEPHPSADDDESFIIVFFLGPEEDAQRKTLKMRSLLVGLFGNKGVNAPPEDLPDSGKGFLASVRRADGGPRTQVDKALVGRESTTAKGNDACRRGVKG